jgi:hypothetical protein
LRRHRACKSPLSKSVAAKMKMLAVRSYYGERRITSILSSVF